MPLIPSYQISGLPPALQTLGENPSFRMEVGDFGIFAQQMFDMGLVFNVEFTEAELGQLPSWSLFDHKITDGISSLRGKPGLPSRPQNMQGSANTTLWSFVKRHSQKQRGKSGRESYHLNPTTPITTSMWTLDFLIQEFAMLNPISGPDDTPMPQHLIIIGKLFWLHSMETYN